MKKRNGANRVDLKDYKEVHQLILVEELTQEEVEEGLEPMEVDVKVAYTKHAIERMFDTDNREAQFDMVEDLILEKSKQILTVKNGEEFILMNKSKTLAVVCTITQQDGWTVISVITVIRKIFVSEGIEIEKRVYVDYKENKVI